MLTQRESVVAGVHPGIEVYPKGYLPSSIGSLRRARTARARDGMNAEGD